MVTPSISLHRFLTWIFHPLYLEPLPSELTALHPNGINLNELLQLKRDEIELRRSEQETRRLELMQQAYDRSTVLPLRTHLCQQLFKFRQPDTSFIPNASPSDHPQPQPG